MKLVLLSFVLVATCFNSLNAQRLEFLNKHHFQVYDTMEYEYVFLKIIHEDSVSMKSQTYTKDGKVKISQYTLIKDGNGTEKNELLLRFYEDGKLQSNCKRDLTTSEELVKTYYKNGQLKSEIKCVEDDVISENYYSDLGEIISKPIVSEGLPKDGISGWNSYLAKTLRYPLDARAANQEGKVIIAFELTEVGEIINPEIANPEEIHPSLGKEALRAVKNYPHMWAPYTVNGKAEMCNTRLPVLFKLTD
ncbi:energy transducer TonB [Algoriphagus sp. D3-2-R+10]|uniref:energy transducer TonB n=1 Tax=Algoriphagus aurantiacus TaxID=3103948 RepID=UPI002B3E314F|nr:energy transducer TonB [Algoriphagus sp. D3-2-R+10]MEB2777168.1 energy transducer TonB [Algoriphagus sp. D3-2-R+10]